MSRKKVKRPRVERLIEGRNPVLEALLAGTEIDQIWIAQGLLEDERIREILRLAPRRQVLIQKVKRTSLDRISQTHRTQGVIAFAASLPPVSLVQLLKKVIDEEDFCFLVLTEVLDEQNLGAILRSAETAGVKGVIIPKSAKGVTPIVSRTAMGAAEYLPVVKENLFVSLKVFRDWGIRIIGAVPQASQTVFQTDLKGPVAFVVGGEHKGITTTVKKNCDLMVSIPMRGQVKSLNMSVACAILAYEKLRQAAVKQTSVKREGENRGLTSVKTWGTL